MTEGRATFVRVGLLMVAGLAVLLGLLVLLGGDRFRSGVLFESYFSESVEGLAIGAPVKYRGVTVGTVTGIGLVAAAYGTASQVDMRNPASRLVFVRYQIYPSRVGRQPDPATTVREGLRVHLAMQGITGISYLELDFVNPELYPPMQLLWTPRGAYVPSMPSIIAQVQDAAQQLLAGLDRVNIVALTASLQGLLVDLRAQVKAGDVHAAVIEATALMQDLRAQLQQADLPGLAADLRQTSQSVRAITTDENLRHLLATASQTADRLAGTAVRLAPLISTLQSAAGHADAGTADLEQALPGILRDVREAAANLRAASDTMRENPALLLRPAPPPPHTVPGR
jgi:paraquat-inducible protein B